jgi:Xaa-Pro aminopeptidase
MATDTMGRIGRLRAVMGEKGWDAVVVRNNPDLRWLTGAERTFDDETAHTAFITQDGLWLHTDSRYFNTFHERLGADTPWVIDEERVGHAAWTADLIARTGASRVAVEDTLELGFYDALGHEVLASGTACLFARTHDALLVLRQVKDEEEIALLREAQRITDEAFEYICGYIKPGMTEQQIRAELESYMLSHGADALSFDSIIASGPNGANPHAQPGERQVQLGDLIVMDYGAGYHDYHADMTRTVSVGEPSEKQKEVYAIVRAANEACEDMIRAGVIGKDVHMKAVEVISEAGYGDFFKHGLGHGVGVEIHESPNFGLSFDREVPEGSVVTVEPGIYLPGEFGIRLEDFGVVTPDGFEVVTKSGHELRVVGI